MPDADLKVVRDGRICFKFHQAISGGEKSSLCHETQKAEGVKTLEDGDVSQANTEHLELSAVAHTFPAAWAAGPPVGWDSRRQGHVVLEIPSPLCDPECGGLDKESGTNVGGVSNGR